MSGPMINGAQPADAPMVLYCLIRRKLPRERQVRFLMLKKLQGMSFPPTKFRPGEDLYTCTACRRWRFTGSWRAPHSVAQAPELTWGSTWRWVVLEPVDWLEVEPLQCHFAGWLMREGLGTVIEAARGPR